MMKEEKRVLRAFALGDGHIRVRGNSYSLSVSHCEKQKEYIIFKADMLSKIIGKKVEVHPYDNKGFPSYRFEVANEYFRFLRKWLYCNGNKTINLSYLRKLSHQGVAIWYMDDGSLVAKRRNGKIHAYDLTISTYCSEKEAMNCISFFNERYGVTFTLKRNKGRFSIRCGTKEAKKLLEIITPYIHKSMIYKTFQTASI